MIDAPNYTQIPNDILDNMAGRSDDEVKILMLICYQTFTWKPEIGDDGMVGLNYIIDKLIIDKPHILKACSILEKDGLIYSSIVGDSTYFSLVIEPD
jgi:hypothetical protein